MFVPPTVFRRTVMLVGAQGRFLKAAALARTLDKPPRWGVLLSFWDPALHFRMGGMGCLWSGVS